jgi:hypothetical protein
MSTHSKPPETLAVEAWSTKRWVAANTVALGAGYGLSALLGGTIEALGADHDSILRAVLMMGALSTAGVLFAFLRQRALLPHVARARNVAIAAGLSVPAAFALGQIGGPPVYFALVIFAVGTVGGTVEWRILRRHADPPRMSGGRRAAIWLAAGIAGVAALILLDVLGAAQAIDTTLKTVLGDTVGDVVSFTTMWSIIGLAGGAIGGAIEGTTLKRRLKTP